MDFHGRTAKITEQRKNGSNTISRLFLCLFHPKRTYSHNNTDRLHGWSEGGSSIIISEMDDRRPALISEKKRNGTKRSQAYIEEDPICALIATS
jgi:hypothetical protein